MKFPFLNKDGSEKLDPTPVSIPVRFRQISEPQRLHQIVQGMLSEHMAKMGAETFEESLDFDVDDDPYPHSSFEVDFVNEQRIDAFERAIRSGQFDAEVPTPAVTAVPGGSGDRNNASGGNSQPVPSGDNSGSSGGS